MPMLTGLMSCGVYDIPKVDFHFDAVVTNTTPIGAYRGAGPAGGDGARRARGRHVRRRDRDGPGRGPPAQLHRRTSRTRRSRAPTTTPASTSRRWRSAWPTRATTSCAPTSRPRRDRGDVVQLGLGLCSYVEWTGFGSELGTCEVLEDGTAVVTAGTSSHGQGHETAYAQLVTGTLGVPLARRQGHPVRHQAGQARHGHDGLALAAGRRQRRPARDRRGAREGAAASPRTCSRPTRATSRSSTARGSASPARPPRRSRGRSWPGRGNDPARAPEGFEGGLAVGERLRDARRDVPVRDPSRGRRGRHRDRPRPS